MVRFIGTYHTYTVYNKYRQSTFTFYHLNNRFMIETLFTTIYIFCIKPNKLYIFSYHNTPELSTILSNIHIQSWWIRSIKPESVEMYCVSLICLYSNTYIIKIIACLFTAIHGHGAWCRKHIFKLNRILCLCGIIVSNWQIRTPSSASYIYN